MDKDHGAPRFRIVLADDQTEVRTALRRFLDRDGRFEIVAEVDDGDQAIEVAARELPDALVLDLAMPTVNGLEALPRIKEVSPGTRVIVLSSMAPFDDARAKATDLGADMVFDKFTSPRKVIKAVAAMLAADRKA